MKELRIDPINKDMIVFAENRSKRPMDKCNKDMNKNSINGYKKDCPFCVGNEEQCELETFRLGNDKEWYVKSVYNRYPIIDDSSEEIYGLHEVMIDTNRHDGSFYNMTEIEFEYLFIMYKNRYTELKNKKNVEYVSIFKNYLRQAGASLEHPHSQIVTLPFIPPEIQNEIHISKEYFDMNNKCLYEGMINEEIELGERVVYNGTNFIAIVPSATKYTGEIRILFKNKISLDEISEIEIKELSSLFKNLFKKIHYVEGDMPFNIYIHTYPANLDCKKYFNTHIHIIPRKYSFGGFELGTGVYVSSRKPEDIAEKLKLT